MAYSSPATVVTGTTINSATFGNAVKTALDYLANKPTVRVSQSVGQSIPNATVTSVTWDVESHKNVAGMHSNVTNNSRLIAPDAGVYLVTANVRFGASATGVRVLVLRKNGTTDLAQVLASAGDDADTHALHISDQVKLAAGDYIEIRQFQSSGGALVNSLLEGDPNAAMTFQSLG